VYDELRKLAAQKMREEKPGQTLDATALVHEAYLRLVDAETVRHWDSRAHFFAAAAEAMRRILVDNARRKGSSKRGGQRERIALSDLPGKADDDRVDLLALDEALRKLEQQHPEKARVVKLRFFAGCTLEETAEILGVSRATAQRTWAYARAWLFGQLNGP
jgi:RNA polymerase sigma factor (TIGR02999 family)